MRKRFRSGLLALVLPVFLSVFSGCTDMVRDDLDRTHAKLQKLQELADSVNRELNTLDLILKELDDGHTILPESLQMTENGYEVSFRDGKKIFIPIGKDGADGRTLIPVGVQAEDGLYYWKVDGEWLLDDEGNRIRAGATDGYIPLFEARADSLWWISLDNGVTFEPFASVEEVAGFGVFKDVEQTASGIILTLWEGNTLELQARSPFRMSFDGPVRDTVLIAAGESLPIPYKLVLEGEADQPIVVTSGTDGTYVSSLKAVNDTSGVVRVQAPADYEEGYILLSATCGGYTALKMITFRQREITPAESFITVRLGSRIDSKELPYQTNFDFVVSLSEDSWLEVVPNAETKALTFTPLPNNGAVRECLVTVSPKDNPDFVCTTFRVLQASESYSATLDDSCPFSFDPGQSPDPGILSVPAEGGEAILWLTFRSSLSFSLPKTADWLQAEMTEVDGFYQLKVHVDPLTEGTGREELISIQTGVVPVGKIKVIQAGVSAGN